MPDSYDAAIIGAGPAGCACAIQLAHRGRRVILVDRPAQRRQAGEALPPAANRLIRELGLMDSFLAGDHLPCYGNLSAWGSDILASTDFIHDPDGHGWHVDRAKFDAMLRRAAGALTPSDFNAAWFIDCTGRSAAVARSRGVRRLVVDTLTAFAVFYQSHSADPESVTLVEAAESGWWYTARVPDASCVAIYFTDARNATCSLARTSSGFSSLLAATKHVAARLETYTALSPPTAMAANSSILEQTSGPGWLAAGDAAAAHDPISSAGIASALASGIHAANAVADALAGDRDAIPRYSARVATAFNDYLRDRARVYGEERRWPNDPFWSSRASGASFSRTIQSPVISSLR